MLPMLSSLAAWPDVPHFDGIFLNLNDATAAWTKEQWVTDFQSMKDVGMTFFCVHHPASGLDANYTTTCPFGRYKTKFPPRYLPSACYEQQAGPAGLAILTMLDALEEVGGMKLHLGLAYTFEATFGLADFARYTALQKEVAAGIWSIIPTAQRALVGGVYAMTEPHNGHYPWDTEVEQISSYFDGLAAFVKSTLRSDLLVWDSPYITGNTTHDAKEGHVMNVSDTAAWWSKVWKLAPSFDLIAIQDHLGQGYPSSFQNVSEYFPAVAATAVAAGRSGMWANIELFGQSTGPNSTGSYYCHNCVAKWPRVKAQLELESSLPHVTKRIAWEWTGCLSPNYGPEGPNTSKALYAEYKAYIDAGVAAA